MLIRIEKQFDGLFHAGLCMLLCNEYMFAVNRLSEANEIDDDHYWNRFLMGVGYYNLGLHGRANQHWWAAKQIQPNKNIEKIVNHFFTDENHPERLALYPLCIGRGIEVGCGHRKTHPNVIGVDLIANGDQGSVGVVTGMNAVTDVQASGDDLYMFKDNELDYVVARHNIEHYQDPIKALQEWKRVIKPKGIIGIVIPDDENIDTIKLDPSHKHVFTRSSFKRLIELIPGLEIIFQGELLKNWSFVSVIRKTDQSDTQTLDAHWYHEKIDSLEIDQALAQADRYADYGEIEHKNQCLSYAKQLRH